MAKITAATRTLPIVIRARMVSRPEHCLGSVGDEGIARAAHCHDSHTRIHRIEFTAQIAHVLVHDRRVDVTGGAPHFLQDVAAGDRLARPRYEISQQREFLRTEGKRLVLDGCANARGVEGERPEAQKSTRWARFLR